MIPRPPAPLTQEERDELERSVGPEVLRQILEKHAEYRDKRATTSANLEFNWNYGKLRVFQWIEVKATRFDR